MLTIKLARSGLTVILTKSNKGLKLVSSLQHRPKNMIEMFSVQYTSI